MEMVTLHTKPEADSVIDRYFSSGIIPVRTTWSTSSMAEQLTLNQWVQGSSPWSITQNGLLLKAVFLLGSAPSQGGWYSSHWLITNKKSLRRWKALFDSCAYFSAVTLTSTARTILREEYSLVSPWKPSQVMSVIQAFS